MTVSFELSKTWGDDIPKAGKPLKLLVKFINNTDNEIYIHKLRLSLENKDCPGEFVNNSYRDCSVSLDAFGSSSIFLDIVDEFFGHKLKTRFKIETVSSTGNRYNSSVFLLSDL